MKGINEPTCKHLIKCIIQVTRQPANQRLLATKTLLQTIIPHLCIEILNMHSNHTMWRTRCDLQHTFVKTYSTEHHKSNTYKEGHRHQTPSSILAGWSRSVGTWGGGWPREVVVKLHACKVWGLHVGALRCDSMGWKTST